MPAIYHEGSWLGNATDPEVLVKDTVGWTGKNWLPELTDLSSASGVTFTKNSDGIITTNGSATARVQKNFASQSDTHGLEKLIGKEVVLSGCPVGGTNATYRLNAYFYDGTHQLSYNDVGEGIAFTFPDIKNTYTQWNIKLDINAGGSASVDVSGKVFYPMLRKADITDPTYEPYHESVEVMYEEEIHGVNLIPFPYNATIQNSNVTVTADNNGVITVNGTQGSTIGQYYLSSRFAYDFKLPAGSYIVTGGTSDCYINVSTNNVTGDSSQGNNFLGSDSGNGFNFTLNKLSDMQVILAIKSGTYSNKKIYPMLRKSDIEDSTYRPYNPQAIQNQLNAQGVLGAKNLLKNTATSQTINGVTFTVNSDGSIKVNGTATANTYYNVNNSRISGDILQSGTFIMTSKAFLTGSYGMYFQERNADDTAWEEGQIDTGNGITITHNSNRNWAITIYVNSGKTASNITFYPMLRLASDPDDTYQPYAMTNRELTEKKINIADLKTVVSASSDFADFKTRIASL